MQVRHAKGKGNKGGKATRKRAMQGTKLKTGVWQHARVSKHVPEAIKCRKRQAKPNQCFKTKFNQQQVLDAGTEGVQHLLEANNMQFWENDAF